MSFRRGPRPCADDIREEVELRDGVLCWRKKRGCIAKGAPISGFGDKDGYRLFRLRGHNFTMHRVIWLLSHGDWPQHTIDHINRVKGDNRIENLRDVPQAVNNQNRIMPAHRARGCGGVSFETGRNLWRAQLYVGRRGFHIGYFKTEQEARDAREAIEINSRGAPLFASATDAGDGQQAPASTHSSAA